MAIVFYRSQSNGRSERAAAGAGWLQGRCCRSLEREDAEVAYLARYLYPRGTASSVDQALSVLAGLEV